MDVVVRPSFQSAFGPLRITATVQNGVDSGHAVLDSIVDGIREPLGEQPMAAVVNGVNTSVKVQGVDVGPERIQEVLP